VFLGEWFLKFRRTCFIYLEGCPLSDGRLLTADDICGTIIRSFGHHSSKNIVCQFREDWKLQEQNSLRRTQAVNFTKTRTQLVK
jgi:hypothetical protein